MVVVHTEGLVVIVGDEGRPLQRAVALHTSEACWVICVPRGSQHAVCDRLFAHGTLIQGASVAVLTLGPPLHLVELQALQLFVAAQADEALRVEETVHRPDCRLGPRQGLGAGATRLCNRSLNDRGLVHLQHESLSHLLQLLHLLHSKGGARTRSRHSCRRHLSIVFCWFPQSGRSLPWTSR